MSKRGRKPSKQKPAKRRARPRTVRKPAARRAGPATKKSARKAPAAAEVVVTETTIGAARYTFGPVEGFGWPPFRYPPP